jgi:ATP-dependent helicase/nuclease subunit A
MRRANGAAASRPLRDQAARELIETALDRNLLVEAGAGSGKTENLVRRMGAGIAAGRYAVERMAAVTFTRKAAAELRGRFQLDLERRLRAETEAGRRERLMRALSRLEQLFAGTIHAFCAHLLRERPVEAGVAPGFTELDDVEDLVERRRAWRAFWDRERGRGSARLVALAEASLGPADLDGAFQTVCRFPEVEFPAGPGAPPAVAPARRALEAFWAQLEPLLPVPIPEGTTCRILDRARDLARRRRVGLPGRPADLAAALERWMSAPGPTLKWWGRETAARQAKALVAGFAQETAAPFVQAWRQYRYRLALDCLADARREAAEARRRGVALNYEDLLQIAARLLRERPDVRLALAVRRRVPGHRSHPGRGHLSPRRRAGHADPGGLDAGRAPAGGPLRRRRSQAVDLPLPPGRHRDLRPGAPAPRGDGRRGGDADDLVPLGPGPLRVGQHRVPAALPPARDPAAARLRPARSGTASR